jgi:nucleoid-associated protein YgaU
MPPLPAAPGAPAVAPATRTVAAPAAAPVAPAAPTKPARAETYTVKEGDSLASIWRGLTGSERGWEKLQAANPGLDPSRLKIGQVLKVPDWSSDATPAKTAAAAPAAAAGTHTVASGDTLSSIAQKVYGESKLWKRIYDANKDVIGSDPANLKVGQVLRIPPKTGEVASPAAPAPKPAPAAPVAPPTTPPGTIGAPTATPASAPMPKPQSP